jgi:hypothetical protein
MQLWPGGMRRAIEFATLCFVLKIKAVCEDTLGLRLALGQQCYRKLWRHKLPQTIKIVRF